MDRKKIAKKLVTLAKQLIAEEVQPDSGPYKVDMAAVKKWDSSPPYIALVRKEIKNGDGLVSVKEVDGDVAEIYGTGTHSFLMGPISVPVNALKKA